MSIPDALTEKLRAGRVIPFVGAGVSMPVKDRETGKSLFPSWRQLLERAADELDKQGRTPYANAVRATLDFDEPDYLDAARTARRGLLGNNWFDFLRNQFDPPRERLQDDSLNLARAIWALGSRLVITTNYDRVLEWACAERDNLNIWDIEAPAEKAAFLQGKNQRPTLWHLHGRIVNAADIILTHDGYQLLYPEARSGEVAKSYDSALSFLRERLASHTFLFVGFSLDDAYFGMQLRGINQIYHGATGPHFVLVREADKARGASFEPPLQVITFEDFGDPLLRVVRELGASAAVIKQEPEEKPIALLQTETTAPRVADYGPHHSVFFVPFPQKGNQVIGREDALQSVRRQLTEGRRTYIGQTAAFQGLGGLGKTQLAVEYAYRYRDSYPNGVIWLNADQDIDAQLTELAEKARWVAPESEHKYKLEVAQHRLRSYSDCLVVFDNLEALQTIKNYLPEHPATPHILVTSRTDQPDFNPVSLDPLDEALSVELLLQEAGRTPVGDEEERAATTIARELGGLPLALELAGAYLRHRHVSWQQYRDLLQENPRSAFLDKFPSFTRHEADLYSTLKINEEVFDDAPNLKDILDLFTWSASAPMGLSLMSALLGVQSSTDLTNALGLGAQLRLLLHTPNTDNYAIHRLVSKVRREEIPLEPRRDWIESVCQRMGDWFQEVRNDFTALPRYEAEIDHLRAWQEHAGVHVPQQASRLLWLQAYPFHHRGQHQNAKEWVEKALKLFEQEQCRNDELKAHLWNDLGYCNSALGDYHGAIEYFKKALHIRLEIFGEQHPDTAMSLNNVGGAYKSLGDNKRALEHNEKALNIQLKLFGEQHHDTARSLNNVGSAYKSLGDNKRALEYQEKALNILLEIFGEQHPDTAGSLNNVGGTYKSLGDDKRALEYQEKALSIRLSLFGEQHPDTARSLNSVGSTYNNLGDNKRALEYQEKALSIRLSLFDEQHPDIANSLNNVGGTYKSLGDNKRALEYQEKALNILLEIFGEQHPDTARSLNNIAGTYNNLGNNKRALEYHDKAVKLFKELIGEQHPDTISATVNLAVMLSNLGNARKAFQLLDDVLRKLPPTHLRYTWVKQQRDAAKNRVPGLRQTSSSGQGQKKRKKRGQ